ncbi:carbon-nitrogen hydrolase family protein [Niastella caeni]|uniref:Carbon-nitrogen hydrolase family protein n=1 Tax=Niastella caeni TaxID=2569763 RepID=A0A4S8I298_9BACT|nr:carbon-nitrogen hydrolase family protein [Niastella caeni]THU41921.1 carbon-nitrogen hydrolase family protein [Niastella caeni]
MKIGVAQTRPVTGDIDSNIKNHISLIELAVSNGADIIVFPELSLTGYEPSLAKELAADTTDNRFEIFQQLSDTKQITIGVGVPTKSPNGIHITMVLFQPNRLRQTNSKMYLHADEEPFFISGNNLQGLIINNTPVALAICYEISIPEHSESAAKSGAQVYIASVAKTAGGVEKATKTLSDIARQYSMTVFMSNCVGMCEDGLCAGKSAVWNNKGELAAQLDDTGEGIIIFETETQDVMLRTV